ncbi:MAG: PhoH family protein [Coxiellaceae bacterium]|nr:PhoH family protein [Coxiellaceae bacterium]
MSAQKNQSQRKITLSPLDNRRLAELCGQFDEHLHIIEHHLGVEISNRGNEFQIIGIPTSIDKACDVIEQVYNETGSKHELTKNNIQLIIKSIDSNTESSNDADLDEFKIEAAKCTIKARTPNQHHYLSALRKYDINFGIGPSGTGKTFLAVASAVHELENEQVSRIILVRPAVEAGEKLGFLPGDLAQKVDPYLRPLYDALVEMLGGANVGRLIEKNVIEIAPLAYMRGRTLNDSFIILDESQNTTQEQMKMFLTRIGFGSKAVITGDITQVDLPKSTASGLRHAITVLQKVPEIKFTFFKADDVVRHTLVQKIIRAYEQHE